MSLSDWYPFNPTEFRRDTYHLCAAADGIYRRLIDEYMVTRKPLPDHDAALAGVARVTAQEWGEHREIVRAFFKAKDGKLFHKRCEQELHAQSMRAAERSRKAKEAATVRWSKSKPTQRDECYENSNRIAPAMLNDATLCNTRSTLTTSVIGERPKAGDKALVASPELIKSLRKQGSA